MNEVKPKESGPRFKIIMDFFWGGRGGGGIPSWKLIYQFLMS